MKGPEWDEPKSIEIATLDSPVTIVTAMDMAKAVSSFVVTARAEQIPSVSRPIGFFRKIGVMKMSLFLNLGFDCKLFITQITWFLHR